MLWPFGLLEPNRFVARWKVAEKVAQVQLLLLVTAALCQGRLPAWGLQEQSSPVAAFGGPVLGRVYFAGIVLKHGLRLEIYICPCYYYN